METKKKALGKGLEQLFSNSVIDFDNFEQSIVEENVNNIVEINLDEIRSNPYQPRKSFDPETLNEMAASIKEYGLLQPVIVKKSIKGYELVAGERRTKAARIAGLTKVPAIIKDFTDQEMMELALIENIQREDLNPIDEATSINNIIKLRGYTQEEFASKMGKSRSYVTNILGLLKLPEEVKKMVEKKEISMSHARVLSKLDDDEQIINLAHKIINEDINVRDLEKMTTTDVLPKKNKIKTENNYRLYENLAVEKLNTKVRITKNKMEIYFSNKEELEQLLERLDIKVEDD